jgi:Ca2+-binding EF-hand superfamily protein
MAQFKGDADNDGKITMLDLPLALKVASGLVGDQEMINRLDIDGDGKVTTADINALYAHINCELLIDEVIY